MEVDDASFAPQSASAPKSVERAASRSPASSTSFMIPDLPTLEIDFEQEIADIELLVGNGAFTEEEEEAAPDSGRVVEAITEVARTRTASPTGNIVAIIPGRTSAAPASATSNASAADIPLPAQGGPSRPDRGAAKRKAIQSSLDAKGDDQTAGSRNSSPASSIPNLPTHLPPHTSPITSHSYPTRGSASAESSTQAAKRARKAATPKEPKAPLGPAETTRQSTGREASAPKVRASKKSAKRTRDAQDEADGLEEENELAAKKRMSRRGAKDASEEPLQTVDEGGEDVKKPVGRAKRKAAPKPTTIRSRPKSRKKTRPVSEAEMRESMKGKTSEIQLFACNRERYAKWGKCTGCTAKSGTDCRFRDFRTFPVDPKTGEISGPGYFESIDLAEQSTAFPTKFTTPLTDEHLRAIEESAAPILLPLITRELRHVTKTRAIKRAVDTANDRSYCDFCSSTIFAGYFFCKTCGRDYCLSCERYFSDAAETMDQSPWHLMTAARTRLLKCVDAPETKRESGQSGRGKDHPPTWHFRGQLQPVSALSEEELKAHWLALAEFVVKGDEAKSEWSTLLGYSKEGASGLAKDIERFRAEYKPSVDKASPTPVDLQSLYTKFTRPSVYLPKDPANLRAESLEFMRVAAPDLVDNSQFNQIWSKGEPIVVDGVGKGFKLNWTPEEMISQFGKERCDISDCEKNEPWGATIKEFFEAFQEHGRQTKDVWKLQDWPAAEGFQSKHPGLYEDFCGALPVPDYTQQNGAFNLYAHFPRGPTKPDIGPKMYNAFSGKELKGGHGSTRLHMDVADAINIMLYSSDTTTPRDESALAPPAPSSSGALPGPVSPPDNQEAEDPIPESPPRVSRTKSRSLSSKSATRPAVSSDAPAPLPATASGTTHEFDPQYPGCAVWDVFRAEDADKLRAFLAKKYAKSKIDFTDPIHSQMFYLDAALRKELWQTMGVASFRIYQYPGQAVFIPAGCAHQVCNLADCIKIAMDFVSPRRSLPHGMGRSANVADNVSRCQQLIQDFRKENFVKVWKDDVLQLHNILWFAWLSARETRDRRQKESHPAVLDRHTQTGTKPMPNILAAGGSSFGRGQVSSMRDDPADGLRLATLPVPPTLSSAFASAEPSTGPAKALVAKLLEAALSAPDSEPPQEARQPIVVSAGRWNRASRKQYTEASGSGSSAPINAVASGSGTGALRRTRAGLLAAAGMEDGREDSPMMSVASVRALATSGLKVNKASDLFREGLLPMEFSVDILKAEMGQGGGDDMEGLEMGAAM